jgi:hypothetical protein
MEQGDRLRKGKRRRQTARKASLLSKKMSLLPKTTDRTKQQHAFTTPPIPEEKDDEPMKVEVPVLVTTTNTVNPLTWQSLPPPLTQPKPPTKHNHYSPRASEPEEHKADSNSSASSADREMSALIPNLNIPVNDGTIRISLRWKTTADVVLLSQNSTQLSAEVHSLLNDIFHDDDGLLYRWADEGMENYNAISKIAPEEV